MTTQMSINDGSAMLPGTNLTLAAVGAMHKDYLRDQRIERILSSRSTNSRRRSARRQPAVTVDNFEAVTGWTREAAADMADQCRREHRLFGQAYYA